VQLPTVTKPTGAIADYVPTSIERLREVVRSYVRAWSGQTL
jgi:hypothetical protein